MYHVGDKFTIEIAEVLTTEGGKPKYRIKPFSSCFLDDFCLQLLEEVQPGDYKERMRAEYLELCERLEKLHKRIIELDVEDIPFHDSEQTWLLKDQESAMNEYKVALERRMCTEGIL